MNGQFSFAPEQTHARRLYQPREQLTLGCRMPHHGPSFRQEQCNFQNFSECFRAASGLHAIQAAMVSLHRGMRSKEKFEPWAESI